MYSLLFQGEKIWALAIVLALIFTYLAYRRTNPPLPVTRRIVMAFLRMMAFVLLFFILLEPLLMQKGVIEQKPKVAVLLDNSLSVSLSDTERAEQLYNTAISAAGGKYETAQYIFSDSLYGDSQTSFDGQVTAIGDVLMYLRNSYREDNLGAAVLISDGQNNIGQDPLNVSAHLPFPVLTVGIGEKEAPRNIAVRRIVSNEVGYVDVPTRALAYIEGWGIEEKVTVKLMHNGELIAEELIEPGMRGQQIEVAFEFTPEEAGQTFYTISVNNVEGENISEDNIRSFAMRVLPSRKKLLIAWDDLGWDVTFMKRALSANEHYEIASIDFSGRIKGELSVPRGIDDLREYDGIFLVDFPISRDWAEHFNAYLEQGGSIYHVLGSSSSFDTGFDSPFSQNPPRWATDEFQPRETVRGKGHPVMDMGEEIADGWTQDLPPLTGFLIGDKLKKGVEILLEHPKLPGMPILALYQSGKSRQVILNGGDFWRWGFTPFGFGADDQIWKALVLNSTDWVLSREEVRPFILKTDKQIYKSGESVYFSASLRNESDEPVDGRVINLSIKGPDGEFSRIMQESGGGFYTLDVGSMDVGEYSVTAEVEDKAGLPETVRNTSFAVEAYSAEYADIRENVGMMQGIAAMSGGEYLSDDQLAETLANLELSILEKRVRNEWDLRHRWWLLVAILFFLAVEWIIRKRSNLP